MRAGERERIAHAKIREKVIALYQKERDRFGKAKLNRATVSNSVANAYAKSGANASSSSGANPVSLVGDVQSFNSDFEELMSLGDDSIPSGNELPQNEMNLTDMTSNPSPVAQLDKLSNSENDAITDDYGAEIYLSKAE